MENLEIRKKSMALITIDMQNDFTLPGSPAQIPGTMDVIPNIRRLLEYFRKIKAPIIHVVRLYLVDGSNVDLCRREIIRSGKSIVRPGTEGAELVAHLKADPSIKLDADNLLRGNMQMIRENEYIMYKSRWGAFYQTPLEKFLKDIGMDSLVFAGCNFPNCPRTSIYEASERDFRIALALDAVSGVYEQGIRELERIGVITKGTDQLISSYRE